MKPVEDVLGLGVEVLRDLTDGLPDSYVRYAVDRLRVRAEWVPRDERCWLWVSRYGYCLGLRLSFPIDMQPYGFDVERTVPGDRWLRH